MARSKVEKEGGKPETSYIKLQRNETENRNHTPG
jgi:hypothetical protein